MENELSAGTETLASKERLGKDVAGMVNQAGEIIKDYGSRKLSSAKETLSEAQSVVSDRARQYADITDEYVRANPWKALGVAAAAGVLVGILLTRR
jgi:ElaB/YqjD/DUF883 family membrane-anchored ribosome-binding protein